MTYPIIYLTGLDYTDYCNSKEKKYELDLKIQCGYILIYNQIYAKYRETLYRAGRIIFEDNKGDIHEIPYKPGLYVIKYKRN